MKHLSSVITTMPKAQPSQTGTQAGEHGLATPGNSERVAKWLAAHSPREVDEVAVSRASQQNVGLRVQYSFHQPRNEYGDKLPSVSEVIGCDVAGSEADRAIALDAIKKTMVPANVNDIEGWVAELSVITARRQDDEFTEALRLSAYASRLREYPADVARHALLGKTMKFFPTWHELKAEADRLVAPRRAMIGALSRREVYHARPEEPRAIATPEQRKAIWDSVFGKTEDDGAAA
jgi:hypothetical protein